ncbi:MAG: HlyD family type I secretion periplasmic adaptor subunit [Rhodocyclaceae bacterium]
MRIGLWVLGLGFGGFLLWAGLAPLDEGVPTQGSVSIDTKRKAVQHLTGGLIDELLVREGQMVEAGQVLIRLDAAASRANFESAHQRYMGLRAMESRLLAEQAGATQIAFPPELLESADPAVQQQIATQRALFASRRAALDAELRAIEESIQGLEAMISSYEGQLASNQLRLASLQEELSGIRDLVNEGYAPRNRQMDLERQVAAVEGTLMELRGNLTRTRRSIAELRERAKLRKQEYRKDGDTQLAQIRLEIQASMEKYRAAADELSRTEIRAPVAGQVVGLSVHTVGGVIQPAQKLMDIVPVDELLLIEARIPPHLIDRIAAGQMADIRFSAFAHSPVLVVEGKVTSVSSDLIVEPAPQGNIAYYLARISLTPDGLKALGDRRLQPGMPAEVVIKTGERTLLTYLLHPLVKRIAASMKEE